MDETQDCQHQWRYRDDPRSRRVAARSARLAAVLPGYSGGFLDVCLRCGATQRLTDAQVACDHDYDEQITHEPDPDSPSGTLTTAVLTCRRCTHAIYQSTYHYAADCEAGAIPFPADRWVPLPPIP